MAKFVFKAKVPQAPEGAGSNVNFDEMNKYIVDTMACADKPESLIGIISGVIDLGLQPQDDAKMVWTGGAAEEALELEKNPNQYFEDLPNDKGVMTRYKRWAVKAQPCVAITVDFPDNLINRGQFFDPEGGGEDLPFRGLLNNEFNMKNVGKIVGKPYSLREQRNDDGTWGFKNNTILFKLGQAVGALQDGNMKPQYLGDLIGQAAMFNVHVHLNEHNGKFYLNEKLSFNGPVPKALLKAVPELDEKFMYVVNFDDDEFDLNVLKQLRQSVVNTMKLAENFEGSKIQAALIEAGKIKEGESTGGAAKPAQKPAPEPKQAKPEQADPIDFDNFDDDIPF